MSQEISIPQVSTTVPAAAPASEKPSKPTSRPPALKNIGRSIMMEEPFIPQLMRFSIMAITATLLCFLVWASTTEITEVTRAEGEVVPSGYVQVVQHLEGGIVSDILVSEGEMVEKGQLMIRLDETRALENLARTQNELLALKIEQERAHALLENHEPNFKGLVSENESYANQQRSFDATVSAREKEASVIRQQISQKHEMVRSLEQRREQLSVVNTQIVAAKQGISEFEQRLASLGENHRDQAAKRFEIRAPTRGLVKSLEVHTVGAVIGAGQQIMEIVPVDTQMIVEAKVSTSDIGHVQVGQMVKIKVHSFDFVRYGIVEGTLESISPTTFIDKSNKAYYRAKIILRQPYVGQNSRANLILPGMTVESDIMTGQKTVMDYLLKPIHVAAQTAMQER